MSRYQTFKEAIDNVERILIVQADNPDGDSIGAALGLEAILGEYGKKVALYCGVDMPDYLKYLGGWSRVSSNIPSQYDLAIFVDVSAGTLFNDGAVLPRLATKPAIVLDHHAETSNDLTASIIINEHDRSSTCELIHAIVRELGLPLPADALVPLATGILGDTQGLSNQLTSECTYLAMADLVGAGLNRPKLEEKRREFSKMPAIIYRFKAAMIDRTELVADGRLALVDINQEEIKQYSPLYNPGPLIQPDMLQIQGVCVGIVFKVYDDGRITAMIRSNPGAEIANKIAVRFGGGGHGFAAGFKVTDGRPFNEIKSECIAYATELLDRLKQEATDTNETVQHTF